jgi:uncharacterized protein YheU (UPF0270 family)
MSALGQMLICYRRLPPETCQEMSGAGVLREGKKWGDRATLLIEGI